MGNHPGPVPVNLTAIIVRVSVVRMHKEPNILKYLAKWITAGLALAFIAVLIRPDWLREGTNVVELHQRSNGHSQLQRSTGPASYASAVERAVPTVVNIYTAKIVTERVNPLLSDPQFRRFFGGRVPAQERKRLQTSLGSGVIVSSQGYVLTNNQVIQGADHIQIQLADGRNTSATSVGSDPDTDLAVLKLDLQGIPAITLGDSSSLAVGDVVLAIGNPFGIGQTVTMGIVSATGRNQLGINTFENFIQTDASINPGNSGGALINANGEMVGINTAIFSRSGGSQGIGFAIPVKLATGVMTEIIEHGHAVRGWLGIEVRNITPQQAEALELDNGNAVMIGGIQLRGPAATAGLRPGDVITHIDDEPVYGGRELLNQVARTPPGQTLQLRGKREGEDIDIEATVGERPIRRNKK